MYTGKYLSLERSGIIGKSRDYNDYCCLCKTLNKLKCLKISNETLKKLKCLNMSNETLKKLKFLKRSNLYEFLKNRLNFPKTDFKRDFARPYPSQQVQSILQTEIVTNFAHFRLQRKNSKVNKTAFLWLNLFSVLQSRLLIYFSKAKFATRSEIEST